MMSSNWLYYKIYPGASAGNFDHLIAHIFPEIVASAPIIDWFFLRYTDDGGPHLRFRLRTSDSIAALQRIVEPSLARALDDLPSSPPSDYRPAIAPVPVDARPAPSPGGSADMRIELADYEPEIEVFGEEGINIAETLFGASSKVTVQVLVDEGRRTYSRKTVVPLFMAAIADAFAPHAGASIWRDYAGYWLDGIHGSSEEWRQRFAAKAAALRAAGVLVLAPDDALFPEAVEPVRVWRTATLAAAHAFRGAADRPARNPRELMFHFVHLMNNRLGLTPIEEAYFATLIGEGITVEPAL